MYHPTNAAVAQSLHRQRSCYSIYLAFMLGYTIATNSQSDKNDKLSYTYENNKTKAIFNSLSSQIK